MARLGRYFPVSHHQQDFDQTEDASCGFGMANIALDRTKMKDRIPLWPAKGVKDTTNLDGVTDTGCMKRLVNVT